MQRHMLSYLDYYYSSFDTVHYVNRVFHDCRNFYNIRMICQPPARSTDTSRRWTKTAELLDIIWPKMQFRRKSLNLLLSNQFIYRETLSPLSSHCHRMQRERPARACTRERVFSNWFSSSFFFLLRVRRQRVGVFFYVRHKPRQNTLYCCCCCTSYFSLFLSLSRHLLVMVTEHGDGRSRTELT